MTDTRHTTTLEIRAETRGVKDLGKEIKSAFDPKVLAAFEASMDRMSSTIEQVVSQQRELVELQKQSAKVGAAGSAAIVAAIAGRSASDKADREEKKQKAAQAREEREAARDERDRGRTLRAAGGGAGRFAGGVSNTAAAAMGGPGLAEGLLGMIPYVGSGLAGIVTALRQYSGMAEGYGSALGGAYGQTGMTGVGGAAFGAYGLSNMDAPAMLAQFAGATGLRGSQLEGLTPDLLDMQRGMGLGSAGNIIRANASGGGSASADTKPIRDAIAAGMMAGIRDGRLDEYLAAIAGHTEAARNEGVNLTTESMTTLVQGFSALGLMGERATSAATSAASSMRNLGEDTSFGSQVALRVAMAGDARTGGTGPRTYEEALAFMENNPDVMTRAMLQEAQGLSGGDRSVTAGNVRRLGLGLGRNASWMVAGRLTSQSSLNPFSGVTEDDRGWANDALAENAARARSAAGASTHRAALTNQGIGIGSGGAGSALRNLESTEMGVAQNMAGAVTAPMQELADTSAEMLRVYNEAGGGMPGMQAIMSQVMPEVIARVDAHVGSAIDTLTAPSGDIMAGVAAGVEGSRTDGPMMLQRAIRGALVDALTEYFGQTGHAIGTAIIRLSDWTARL